LLPVPRSINKNGSRSDDLDSFLNAVLLRFWGLSVLYTIWRF